MYKTNVQFTALQIDQLKELSKRTGAGRSELVRRAVEYYTDAIQSKETESPLLTLPNPKARKARRN